MNLNEAFLNGYLIGKSSYNSQFRSLYFPSDYLSFDSYIPFTLEASDGVTWNGTLEYSTNGVFWKEWDGRRIYSEQSIDYYNNMTHQPEAIVGVSSSSSSIIFTHHIFIRGKNNTRISDGERWIFNFTIPEETREKYIYEHYSPKALQFFWSYFDSYYDYDYSDYQDEYEEFFNIFLNGIHIQGNLLSLLNYTEFYNNTLEVEHSDKGEAKSRILPSYHMDDYCFANIFENAPIINTPTMDFSEIQCNDSCFIGMFRYSAVREAYLYLNLQGFEIDCCASMFEDCQNLRYTDIIIDGVMPEGCCQNMFKNCHKIREGIVLPSTSLAQSCYYNMFYYCTNLWAINCDNEHDPVSVLPATQLAISCYDNMFNGCTNLEIPPALPATVLPDYCYNNMFRGCKSFSIPPDAPEPITSIGNYSCRSMFYGTNITQAPQNLFGTSSLQVTEDSYAGMFLYCSLLKNAPYLPSRYLSQGSYDSMFAHSGLENPPRLPATELGNSCYSNMFGYCSNLKALPLLPAWNIPNNSYSRMFYNTNIDIQTTQDENHQHAWIIPEHDSIDFTRYEDIENWEEKEYIGGIIVRYNNDYYRSLSSTLITGLDGEHYIQPTVDQPYRYEEIDPTTGEPVEKTGIAEWNHYWEEVTGGIGIYHSGSFYQMFDNTTTGKTLTIEPRRTYYVKVPVLESVPLDH